MELHNFLFNRRLYISRNQVNDHRVCVLHPRHTVDKSMFSAQKLE